MNSKLKQTLISMLLMTIGMYVTIFGIYAISIIHFFANGLALTMLGVAILMLGMVALLNRD